MILMIKRLQLIGLIVIALSACSNAEYAEEWVDDTGVHECGNAPGLTACDTDNESMLLQTDAVLAKEAEQENEKLEEQEEEQEEEQKKAKEEQEKLAREQAQDQE